MRTPKDVATVRALRGDVALQIARFLKRQQLSQAAAAKLLCIPQPTLSKIVNGKVSDLSLESLLRITVRAGLQLVLQTGAVPEEAGAFLSNSPPSARTGVRSKLAEQARDALRETSRQMTPEQRLNAQLKLSELVTTLQRAARKSRENRIS